MGAELLHDLSPEQVEVVTTDAAPLAVLAGPGSGKTRVLSRRVAWRCQVVDPAHVLVLTFSRRAAADLEDRLHRLGLPTGARRAGVVAGTFHAVAWAAVTRHRAERGQEPLAILGRPTRLLVPALEGVLGRRPWPSEVSALAAELGWARRQAAGPADYARLSGTGGRRPALTADVVVAAWLAYERAKRSRRVLDLDDVVAECTRLLVEDADAGAAARWRHRHVFVDEYQDLNPAHLRLLKAWTGSDVCVVGDPDQAVYGFNGAMPDLFDRVASDWPGVHVMALRDNFRSTPEVVALAEAVRPSAPGCRARAVAGGGSHVEAGQLSGAGGGRARRAPGALPSVTAHADEVAEAGAVAAAIAAQRGPGRPWGSMAVLARTNDRLRGVADALDRVGVPWRLRDPRPLADRPGVHTWLDRLPGTAPIPDLEDLLAAAPAGPDEAALTRAIAAYRSEAPGATVGRFATWLDLVGVTEEAPAAGVDLATFHGAKGLEWPSVWVVGLEEGLVPLGSATDPDALAEEQRLLYVAITRAEEAIGLSWARAFRGAPSLPSRWLAPLLAAAGGLACQPSAEDQRARLAHLRGGLPTAGSATRERLRVLLEWRQGRARAARVPPAAVLPDRVVRSLAAGEAATESDLLRAGGDAGRRMARWAPELADLLAR